MNTLLKIVTLLNWIIIALLAFVVIAETLNPAKGGDAAGRGIGQALYYGAIMLLVVLLILNLLPFQATKYLAFLLLAIPLLWFKIIGPKLTEMERQAAARAEEARPIFPDPELDRICRAFRDGDVQQFGELLRQSGGRFNEDGKLLTYTISDASGAPYKPEEKRACVRLLLESGARLASTEQPGDTPAYIHTAMCGDLPLLRLLFEHGANANAYQPHLEYAILFEAVGAHTEPEAVVRFLLDKGADPNATAVFDEEDGPITPLWRAAKLERWGVCAALLEKGADPDYKVAGLPPFRQYVEEKTRDFSGSGYATVEDLERLKKRLR